MRYEGRRRRTVERARDMYLWQYDAPRVGKHRRPDFT